VTEHLKEGLHKDIPLEQYISDPAPEPSLSKGTIKRIIQKTPAHAMYHHPRLNPNCPREDSTRTDLGSAVHSQILGGPEVIFAPEEFTDWKKKAAQIFRKEAREEGKIALLAKNQVEVATAAVNAKKVLQTLPHWKDDYQTEGTMIWKDGASWKRGRFDIWNPGSNCMIDVRTCTSADPAQWIKTNMMNGGYDIQAEHYLDGICALEKPKRRPRFFFLLVEIEPPFCSLLVALDPEYEDFAQRKIKHGTHVWQACLESGTWPGYSTRPHYAELKPWVREEAEVRMLYNEEALNNE